MMNATGKWSFVPRFELLLVAMVAVGLCVPLAHVGWFSSHESDSYVARTVEWAAELRRGELYPRWCPDFYWGYGSPFFMFHGPVVYASAGLLTATFFDAVSALKIVVLVGSLLAGLGTYALVFGETGRRDAALLGAIAYMAAPYRLGDLYDRGDIGEFSCIALLPAVIASYRATALEPLPRRARWLAVGAALLHAVLIMTHTVLGLWGTLVIGVVVLATLLGLVQRRLWRRSLLLIGALACAPGLASVFIVPAMIDRVFTHTAEMALGYFKPTQNWITLTDLFDASIPRFPRNFLRIGPLVALAGGVLALGLVLNARRARSALGWMSLTVVLILATLPEASWFWEPGRVPLAGFIQFPWRLLGPAALAASVALGIALAAASERASESVRAAIAIVGSAALLFGLAWPYVSAPNMRTAIVASDPDSVRSAFYSTTTEHDFLPRIIDAPPSAPSRELVKGTGGAVAAFVHSDGSEHLITLEAGSDQGVAELALHGFPGWKAKTLSGPAEATLLTDPAGLLRLELPAAGTYRVRVWFGASNAAYLGMLGSVLSVLALGLLLARGSRWWPGRIPREVTMRSAA